LNPRRLPQPPETQSQRNEIVRQILTIQKLMLEFNREIQGLANGICVFAWIGGRAAPFSAAAAECASLRPAKL